MSTSVRYRAWKRTSDAVLEPVTLAEAKLHLRQDGTADDSHISALITAARQHLEETYSLALITQTWSLVLDEFPEGDDPIYVPRPPLISVTSIVYLDGDGASQTWAASNYRVDTTSTPGRITLAASKIYPLAKDVAGAVTVTYTAGFGAAASSVPVSIKQAALLLVGHWYANREAEVVGTVVGRIGFAVDALMAPWKVHWFG